MPWISEELRYHVILKMKKEVNQKKVARDLNMYNSEDLGGFFEDCWVGHAVIRKGLQGFSYPCKEGPFLCPL